MHYLFFANSFDINNSMGSGRLNDIIDGLLEKGHQITLITSSFDYLTGKVLSSFNGGLSSIENWGNATLINSTMISCCFIPKSTYHPTNKKLH